MEWLNYDLMLMYTFFVRILENFFFKLLLLKEWLGTQQYLWFQIVIYNFRFSIHYYYYRSIYSYMSLT